MSAIKASAASPAPALQRPLRVLLVDDCLESIRLMSHMLDQYKCEVTMAFDGEDSIPLLLKQNYDLIILDWQMPLMSGGEMLLMLDNMIEDKKLFHIKKSIPVIVYSAHQETELNIPKCRHFHFLGMISKQKVYSKMMQDFNYILRSL